MNAVKGKPHCATPALIATQRPHCPPYVDSDSVEDLLPYGDAVAKRPCAQDCGHDADAGSAQRDIHACADRQAHGHKTT